MPDQIFENPLLVKIYDAFDGERRDLTHYLSLVKELEAKSVIDVGCGTGSFPNLIAQNGIEVVGIDPAKESIEIAKTKEFANKVKWIVDYIEKTTITPADLIIMTGNVAQVFTTDDQWVQIVSGVKKNLRQNGHFIFEVRDPSKRAWEKWNKENTFKSLNIEGVGQVEGWCDLLDVSGELVSFRWNYLFKDIGKVLTSDSTLRFRSKDQIIDSLEQLNFTIKEIRDAPDRPGKEFVFIATL